MTPAPHGVTEIESEEASWHPADKQQPCNITVWISGVSRSDVCVFLARQEENHVTVSLFFFYVPESGFMASLTTANISSAPTYQADIK